MYNGNIGFFCDSISPKKCYNENTNIFRSNNMENNINGLENYPTDAISLTKKLVSISSTDPGDYEIYLIYYRRSS